jgi:hypothetical protein
MKINETIKKGTMYITLAVILAFLLHTANPWLGFLIFGAYVGWIRNNEPLKEAVVNSVYTALYSGLILCVVLSIFISFVAGVAILIISPLVILGGIIGWFISLLIQLGNSNKSNSK